MYYLDGVCTISFAEDIEATTDEEAIAKAREVRPDSLQCEIWEGSRLVTSLRRENRAG